MNDGSFNQYAPYIGSGGAGVFVLWCSNVHWWWWWWGARALHGLKPDPEKRDRSTKICCTTRKDEKPQPHAQVKSQHGVLERPSRT